ncbi:STAS domain-containing protein [Leptothermofonsia sp. ETS-13]|uniref:STAS domain-containing protein n=1 Tax=Leptothermofonsia sp. ETS-13 TaxID=3035696 RepID=UPI003BA2CC98
MSTTNNYKVIQPAGILTVMTASQLIQEFKDCLDAGVKNILVNLQNVDFIDSSGLGILVSIHTKLRLAGGQLYLCSPKDQARSLFDISDLDRIFEIYSSQEEFHQRITKQNLAVLVQ